MPEFPPIDVEPMRGTDGAALAAEYTATRAASLEFLGRSLEGYTPIAAMVSHNDQVYVTVLNITGRGFLLRIATNTTSGTTCTIVVKLTLDGVVVIDEETLFDVEDNATFLDFPMSLGFDTSCLLEMKGNENIFTGEFYGVANVE